MTTEPSAHHKGHSLSALPLYLKKKLKASKGYYHSQVEELKSILPDKNGRGRDV
jgi:hypothetical protein